MGSVAGIAAANPALGVTPQAADWHAMVPQATVGQAPMEGQLTADWHPGAVGWQISDTVWQATITVWQPTMVG